MAKNLLYGPGPFDPNLGCQFFFFFFKFKNLAQTDKSDFIGCCPTNVERPIEE